MELQTMVLGGIEYVLIPKEIFNKSVGIEEVAQPEPVPPPAPTPAVSDFADPTPPAPPPVIETSQPESIVIVDTMPNVRKAQGKEYGYAKRLKEQNLRPEDVMVVRTSFEDMPETPEIARNDFKSKTNPQLIKAKWGFYGEGVERDLG